MEHAAERVAHGVADWLWIADDDRRMDDRLIDRMMVECGVPGRGIGAGAEARASRQRDRHRV